MHGIEYTPSKQPYYFDNFQFTIQSAIDEEGVALANTPLVRDLLRSGSLIQICPEVHHKEVGLYVEFEPNRISKEKRDEIYAWLRQEVGDHD